MPAAPQPAPAQAGARCARARPRRASRRRRAAVGRGVGAARMEAAARRQLRRATAAGRRSTAAAAAARRARLASGSGPWCRGAAGGATASRLAARSTIRPAYITATRSQVCGDHAEIVGDQDDRQAVAVAQLEQQAQDLRLHGDVERGGRLVGDQQLRPARPARWRSSRAGACRRDSSMRIGVDAARRDRECRPGAAARPPGARASRRARPCVVAQRLGRSGRRSPSPGRDGSSGSGRSCAMPPAAHAAHLASRRAPAGRGPRTARARRRCARGEPAAGRSTARQVTVLPRAALADQAHAPRPRASSKRDARRPPAAAPVGVANSTDRSSTLEQRQRVIRGSPKCSARPSAEQAEAERQQDDGEPGKARIHQAVAMKSWPSAIITPHSGGRRLDAEAEIADATRRAGCRAPHPTSRTRSPA